MSKVRVHPSDDIAWVTLRSLYPPQLAAERRDAEMDSTMSYHEAGTEGSLHLTEYKYLANANFDLHAHDLAEIIYVLEGTMVFGNRELGPGSSVYIGADTLYGFAAGNEGLRILIFMGDGRAKFFSKDDYLRLRSEKAHAAAK